MNKTVCTCGRPHMIRLDGNLWHGPPAVAEEMQKVGWQYVNNPKRWYYPEFDQTLSTYRKRELNENEKEIEILHVELV